MGARVRVGVRVRVGDGNLVADGGHGWKVGTQRHRGELRVLGVPPGRRRGWLEWTRAEVATWRGTGRAESLRAARVSERLPRLVQRAAPS